MQLQLPVATHSSSELPGSVDMNCSRNANCAEAHPLKPDPLHGGNWDVRLQYLRGSCNLCRLAQPRRWRLLSLSLLLRASSVLLSFCVRWLKLYISSRITRHITLGVHGCYQKAFDTGLNHCNIINFLSVLSAQTHYQAQLHQGMKRLQRHQQVGSQ